MNRLIRGLGAATSESRTGFYTTLVALLSTTNDEYISVSTLLEIMESQLSVPAGSNYDKVSFKY